MMKNKEQLSKNRSVYDEELFNCFKVLKKQLGNYRTMKKQLDRNVLCLKKRGTLNSRLLKQD